MSVFKSGFVRAVMSSAAGTGISRVFGLFRDQAIGAVLGAGQVTDAFWIAFTIPNTFRRFVADEGLTGALIPAVAQAEAQEGPDAAKRLVNNAFTVLMLVNLVLCLAGVWGAEWVVKAFALAFSEDPELMALTVDMTRWLFPFTAMVSMVSFAEGLLNHRGHFFWPKFAPALVSAGMVAGVLLWAGGMEQPVYAVVYGTLVGGVAHVLVNVPPLVSRWGWLGLRFAWSSPRLRALLGELGKVVLIGIFAQINILVLRQVAAELGPGAVTHYWYANRLVDLTQGIIAVAVGSALLPLVSRSAAARDWPQFEADLGRAFRLAGFLLLPAAAALLVFGTPLAAMLFRFGAFTWSDVQATGNTLVLLVPFMLAVAGINLVKKAFFALDARIPLLAVGAVGVGLTAGLGFPLGRAWGLPGLAAALSLSTSLQFLAYLVLLKRRLGAQLVLTRVFASLGRTLAASVPVFGCLWLMAPLGDWSLGPLDVRNVAVFVGGCAASGLLYAGACQVLDVKELTAVTARLRKRLGR